MAVTVPKAMWEQFYRIQVESAFGAGGGTADWNIGGNGGGATGWRDAPVIPGSVNINPKEVPIFAQYAAGKRAINQQAPVPGAYSVEGSFEMPVYIELIDPFLEAVLGADSRTPTAGTAALASTLYASVATLDTQPDGTEVLKFVVASSTAASAAVIDIIQNAVTVEQINIGTSGTSVDGDYYSKGAYDGSVNAITFSVAGTVTAGTVVISGVDSNSVVHSATTTSPSLTIEEAGQPRSATSSGFYNGVVIPTLSFTFDRTALDGLLMATATMEAQFVADATAGTYANDPKQFYHPLGGWTASITIDGVAYERLSGADFEIDGGNHLFAIASGAQNPSGANYGGQQVTGTLNIIPEDATDWNKYVGQTVNDVHLTFTSPNNIVDSTPWTMLFEFSELYFEDYQENVTNDMFGAAIAFRTTDDASDGIVKVTSVSRMSV